MPTISFSAKRPRAWVFSGGRHAVIPSLYLKKKYGNRIFTVHIQDPTINPKRFDLVVAPAHDFVRGENVLSTSGAIHHLDRAKLDVAAQTSRAEELLARGKPVVAVLLGGPNKYYDFSNTDAQAFIERLKTAAKSNVHLAIIRSRRTPQALWQRIYQEFHEEHFVWDGTGENPYLPAIAIAKYIVSTGDSVSMISEATTTGLPIHVFQLTETRTARRFRRFHQQFREQGFTRPFEGELQTWQYEIPNNTQRVAEVIRQRIAASQQKQAAA